MKALSLIQPFATLLAIGAKTVETRSWGTAYRGIVAIHASKKMTEEDRCLCATEPFRTALCQGNEALPLGAIIAIGNLHRCGIIGRNRDGQVVLSGWDLPITDPRELAFGNFEPRRFGWAISNVHKLAEPVPCRGTLGLWEVPPDVLHVVESQLGLAAV